MAAMSIGSDSTMFGQCGVGSYVAYLDSDVEVSCGLQERRQESTADG